MNPDQAVGALRALEQYLKDDRNPDRSKVASELLRIRESVLGSRTSAQLGKFTKKEFDIAFGGIQSLVDKVTKATKTMNPQDPEKKEIEGWTRDLLRIKDEFSASYKGMSNLNL